MFCSSNFHRFGSTQRHAHEAETPSHSKCNTLTISDMHPTNRAKPRKTRHITVRNIGIFFILCKPHPSIFPLFFPLKNGVKSQLHTHFLLRTALGTVLAIRGRR